MDLEEVLNVILIFCTGAALFFLNLFAININHNFNKPSGYCIVIQPEGQAIDLNKVTKQDCQYMIKGE